MSKPALHMSISIRKALLTFPQGMPLTTPILAQWEVSRQLAYWYTKNGWFEQLGYGYFLRVGDTLTETGAVTALESNGVLVHLAGKSALMMRGYSHYLPLRKGRVYLYGRRVRKLPEWFLSRFTVKLTSTMLFNENEQLDQRLFVRRLETNELYSPYVSDPERAVLEMLDNVPLEQSVEEAKQLMEGMYSLNAGKLQILLQACTKVKVKRLFWLFSEELGLPALNEIDSSIIDFGSESPYTIQGEKSLVLKNPLT
jgi:hypothetical protein